MAIRPRQGQYDEHAPAADRQVSRPRRLWPGWLLPTGSIFLLTLFAHGLLIPWLGFYWDDMPKSWFLHLLGPMGFWRAYQVDRPFLPWIYMLTTPLIGVSPLGWQVLGLMARFLTAIVLWWVLRSIWPRRHDLALLGAMFFVIYPGFLQGPISLIYSHYFLLYALFLASLGGTVMALRRTAHSRRLTAAALVGLALTLFSFEYLVGLEFVRPLVIGLVLWQMGARGRLLITRAAKAWLPYAAVLVAYLIWRALILGFPTYEPELLRELAVVPATALGGLVGRVATDLYVASIGSWVNALQPPGFSALGRTGLAAMGIAGAGALSVAAWALVSMRAGTADPRDGGRRADLLGALALGAWALVVAGAPVWTSLLPLKVGFPWDRLTLPFMLGVSLLTSGFLLILFRSSRLSIGACAVLLALGAAFHASNAVTYVRDWAAYSAFMSQLNERIPGLEPGTVVLTDEIPFDYITDNSLTAPVNWAYAPDLDSTEMPYLVFSVPLRLGRGLPSLAPGTEIFVDYRATTFTGSTSQAIVVFYKPYDCLQALDADLHESMPTLSEELVQAMPLSRLELIRTDPVVAAYPPYGVGREPGWCTIFEQADLARQRGDWARAAGLGDAGLSGADQPNHGSEYVPFIEAYAHVGRWDEALHWTQVALERNPEVSGMICHLWFRIEEETVDAPARAEALQTATGQAGCSG